MHIVNEILYNSVICPVVCVRTVHRTPASCGCFTLHFYMLRKTSVSVELFVHLLPRNPQSTCTCHLFLPGKCVILTSRVHVTSFLPMLVDWSCPALVSRAHETGLKNRHAYIEKNSWPLFFGGNALRKFKELCQTADGQGFGLDTQVG